MCAHVCKSMGVHLATCWEQEIPALLCWEEAPHRAPRGSPDHRAAHSCSLPISIRSCRKLYKNNVNHKQREEREIVWKMAGHENTCLALESHSSEGEIT